jgi:small subunit ribosomal protein S7
MNSRAKVYHYTAFNNLYNEYSISFINVLTKCGNKELAEKIYSDILCILKTEFFIFNPIIFIKKVVDMSMPFVDIKFIKVSSRSRLLKGFPIRSSLTRRRFLAVNWILAGAFQRQERHIAYRVVNELINASNGTSIALKRKLILHNLVLTNMSNIRAKKYFLPNR